MFSSSLFVKFMHLGNDIVIKETENTIKGNDYMLWLNL